MTTIICIALFLSTLSLRRATLRVLDGSKSSIISIHALLAESDNSMTHMLRCFVYFYPRSPCGERRIHYDNFNLHCVISIHALLAESDGFERCGCSLPCISIHALLAESDCIQWYVLTLAAYFYPRSPCGERHRVLLFFAVGRYFYPRSPCGERRGQGCRLGARICISIHALLAESDICVYWTAPSRQ